MADGLNRRALIRLGALGGTVLARPVLAGPAAPAARRTDVAAAPPVPAFALEEATIRDLQKRMESGEDSARSLTEKYIARIEAVDVGGRDEHGPSLHSVLEVNPDALAIADRLDAERKAGQVRGPLHGIPVLLKDNIGTADRCRPRRDRSLSSAQLPPRTLTSSPGCATRVRSSSARPTCPSGRTSARRTRPADGAAEAASAAIPMRSTAIPRDPAPAPGPRPRRASARSPSVARRTARSCRRPTTAGSSASSPRSGSSAGPASSRSRTVRTRRGRWRARSPTRRFC